MDTREVEVAPVLPPPPPISRNFSSLLALNRVYQGKGVHVYSGTADRGRVTRSRAKNKTARKSRRRNRVSS